MSFKTSLLAANLRHRLMVEILTFISILQLPSVAVAQFKNLGQYQVFTFTIYRGLT